MDRLPALLNAAASRYANGQFVEAQALLGGAMGLDPTNRAGLHLIGLCAAAREEHEKAARAMLRALQVAGDRQGTINETLATTLVNVAVTRGRSGDADGSLRVGRQALAIRPDHRDALIILATTTLRAGRPAEAAQALIRATVLDPMRLESWRALGDMLIALRRLDAAFLAFKQALILSPDVPKLYVLLGYAALSIGDSARAEQLCWRALSLGPDHAAASNLAIIRMREGRIAAALSLGRIAAALQPDVAETWVNLGSIHMHAGSPGESARITQHALTLRPVYSEAHSNILIAQEFLDIPPLELLGWHRRFDAIHGRPRAAHYDRHTNTPDPNRRLRVGYVSSDFRQHVASCFFEPLLAAHDPTQVEAICYSDTVAPDGVTRRLTALAGGWRVSVGAGEAELAAAIRADRIDILVDLTGHSSGNRQTVFARRPAPIQVTWLGYPDTSGLSAMDYRIVDGITDPEGIADGLACETLIRLPDGFLCYWPPKGAPEPSMTRSERPVTFGSFNKLAKITPNVIAAWATILRRRPEARLLLKALGLADDSVRNRVLGQFSDQGVPADRLELIGWSPSWLEHLALYNRIDVALDSFPYNGTTTTCEALWMGVPVVTWLGERHAARVGASLLRRIGLHDLIAMSLDDYVDRAAWLAADPARLATLRAETRSRMRASPLCDALGFARRMEDAYRTMWQRWCSARLTQLE